MKGLIYKKPPTEYFNISSDDCYKSLGESIASCMSNIKEKDYTPVILCIGTDRATGDCLGPLVGEQLVNYHGNYRVYGTLSSPVHALNLKDIISHIRCDIQNPYVIAVDASLGMRSHVGYVTFCKAPIAPGKGVNKKLPAIGDISITGIVNVSNQSTSILQSTRLYTVMQLANCIADSLKYAIDYLDNF